MFDQTLMEMKQLVLIEAAMLQIFFSIVAALLFVVSVLFLQPLLTPRKLEKSYRKASVNGEPSALGGSTGPGLKARPFWSKPNYFRCIQNNLAYHPGPVLLPGDGDTYP